MIENFVEITLDKDEDFLKVRETLTRIGIAVQKNKQLMQSCHILHKRERYYIVHFKELYMLDGKEANFSEEDKARRNTIATLLDQWGLCKIVDPESCKEPRAPLYQIKILSHKDRDDWELVPKYNIGNTRKNYTPT